MPNPKPICLFCSTSFIGGTERMALAFLRGCDRSRFTPFLITLLGEGPLLAEARRFEIPVLSLNWQGWFDRSAKAAFKKFLIENKIELIHNFGLRAELLSRPLAKSCGVKKIVSGIRDTGSWRKWHHVTADRLTSGKVDLYIANSQRALDEFQKREKISPEKSRVIYNGLELPQQNFEAASVYEKYNLPKNRSPVLIVLANLVPKVKGHDVLFAAVQRLVSDYPGLLLICAGVDKSEGKLQALAEELGLANNIHFTGYVEQVFEPLSIADIAVLPSRYESFPVSILEAMSMKLPVVAGSVGGIPEVLQQGENGLLFKSEDVDELTQQLKKIIEDKNLQQRLGKAARKTVEEKFTLQKMNQQIMDAYSELLA